MTVLITEAINSAGRVTFESPGAEVQKSRELVEQAIASLKDSPGDRRVTVLGFLSKGLGMIEEIQGLGLEFNTKMKEWDKLDQNPASTDKQFETVETEIRTVKEKVKEKADALAILQQKTVEFKKKNNIV